MTLLEGEPRTLYLACDAVRTASDQAGELAAAAVRDRSEAEVEETLAPLVAQGLALREGRRYLSLDVALAAKSHSP
jgi:hypothetical protein